MEPIVIVGAGLAGLTCARRLHAAGRACVVLEAADAVGGRVRTDVVDGFRLDRGFQVLLTAYPEAKAWLDYDALALRPFKPGALVQIGQRRHVVADPWRSPGSAWATLLAPVGSLWDKLRIASLRRDATRGACEELFQRPETTTAQALAARGFSARLTERFLRPWLGGIFLERELATSSRMLDFVFRMFAEGEAALPAHGMGQIPLQLAAGLPPGTVRLRTLVTAVEPGGVRLTARERIPASHVVVATDAAAASALLPALRKTAWRGVTCLYFGAPRSPVAGAWLVLNGNGRGVVNNVAVLSEVSPDYAPGGQALVSVSVVSTGGLALDQIERTVRAELADWFGPEVQAWKHLRTYRIPEALPVRHPLTRQPPVPLQPGLWTCGDHQSTASIQGAMESGRAVAEAILALPGRGQ